MSASAENEGIKSVAGQYARDPPGLDPLGDILVALGKLSVAELRRVLALRKPAESVATLLTKLGLVCERDVTHALAGLLGMTPLDAAAYPE
ncbi:MAG TPA: hypothetical protein VJA26_08065, partial [Gammaproteobacteria bacterium]|nr:hypothetical protein [Gammaproteobacteria bacterium]